MKAESNFTIERRSMPPSGFSKPAVKGALQFILACYQDLLEEVRVGKHKNYKAAIKYEIKQIKKALGKVHIDRKGNLVER
jgi:hypothetical protein